jgi:hypothetical protein
MIGQMKMYCNLVLFDIGNYTYLYQATLIINEYSIDNKVKLTKPLGHSCPDKTCLCLLEIKMVKLLLR